MPTRFRSTAPILGVLLGGTIIDKLGGYQGAVATARTLKCCALFAVCAASSAALCAFVPKLIGEGNSDSKPSCPSRGWRTAIAFANDCACVCVYAVLQVVLC